MSTQALPQTSEALSLVDAMAIARRSVAVFTELPIDSVVSCIALDGGWQVNIDVIEGAARMGDNDLLAAYEVSISPSGEVSAFSRKRRYHREDREPAE
ncbi:MAG: gas vesicle protein GvpO [Pseudomonadota bacterium]